MDVAAFLTQLQQQPFYDGQLAHVEKLPAREGRFGKPAEPLPAALSAMLATQDAEQLYCHQAEAIDVARAGRDWVVVTGTASGKTLCYHLPILESVLADPDATALYLYPTKALVPSPTSMTTGVRPAPRPA